MQWEPKVGPAFVATIFVGLLQLCIGIFVGGMIWANVGANIKATDLVAIQVAKIIETQNRAALQIARLETRLDLQSGAAPKTKDE